MPRRLYPPAVLTLAAALVFVSTFRAPGRQNSTPIPPARVTLDPRATTSLGAVLAAVEKQTGIAVDAGGLDPARPCDLGPVRNRPFWQLLDDVAAKTDTRVIVTAQGRRVGLTPAAGGHQAASTDGAFRVTARAVAARTDLDTGRTAYDLTLDVNWEPRFPVFRIDSQPTVTAGADDRGHRLTVPAVAVKSQVTGYAHTTTVRVDGLTRASGRIATLAGSFIVTASPKMLTFTFDDLGGQLPAVLEKDGVTAKLVRLAKEDDRWEVDLDLTYPPGQPEFESFESWTSGNVLKLASVAKGEVFVPDNFDVAETARRVRATYRFRTAGGRGPDLGDRKGWRLVYETPAPLVECPVRFELKDIPLP